MRGTCIAALILELLLVHLTAPKYISSIAVYVLGLTVFITSAEKSSPVFDTTATSCICLPLCPQHNLHGLTDFLSREELLRTVLT